MTNSEIGYHFLDKRISASQTLIMNPLIDAEIRQFEALQKKYDDVGADDTSPDYIFQILISHAVTNDPVDVDGPIEWELYEEPGSEAAAKELTEQGWKVYKIIQELVGPQDMDDLQKYCWRLDKSEFESWTI